MCDQTKTAVRSRPQIAGHNPFRNKIGLTYLIIHRSVLSIVRGIIFDRNFSLSDVGYSVGHRRHGGLDCATKIVVHLRILFLLYGRRPTPLPRGLISLGGGRRRHRRNDGGRGVDLASSLPLTEQVGSLRTTMARHPHRKQQAHGNLDHHSIGMHLHRLVFVFVLLVSVFYEP